MNCYRNMWMEKLEAAKERSFKQQQLGTDSQMRDGGKKNYLPWLSAEM